MAVVLRNNLNDAVGSGTTNTLSSYNSESGVVTGNTILVVHPSAYWASTGNTVTDVTFNGVSLTKVTGTSHEIGGNEQVIVEAWYQVNPSGTADIVATYSSEVGDAIMHAAVLDGAVEQAPEASDIDTDASSPAGPHTVTTITDGAFIFDCIASSPGSAAATTETDQVLLQDRNTGGLESDLSTRQAGDAGAHTMGWTLAGIDQSAHVITAWEDAGAWISNIVSAHTQGNEDAVGVFNAAQVSTVTTPLPSADWGRVFKFADNASQGGLLFNVTASNHSASTALHHIVSYYFYIDDSTPEDEFTIFAAGSSNLNPNIGANRRFHLSLETDGDLALYDDGNNLVATATTPFSDASSHKIEIRYLPNASAGEVQVWVNGTSIINETGIDMGVGHGSMQFWAVQGALDDSGGDNFVYFSGGPVYINSAHASDRLDSNFEVIGPFGDTDKGDTDLTPDSGNDLSEVNDGWGKTQDIPFSDEGNNDVAKYTGGAESGTLHFNAGTRDGPLDDSRIDGDSNIKAWKGLWRLNRSNGSGTVFTGYLGDASATFSSGFDSQAFTVNTASSNFYFVTDDSTNMPPSTDDFSMGFGKDGGGRSLRCTDMTAFVLHVPSAAATSPQLIMAPYKPQ